MRNIIFAFLLVTSVHGFGQSLKMNSLIGNYSRSGEIEGVVTDAENENNPLVFAEILVKDTNISTETDINGSFKLLLKPGKYTLIFSFIGYKSIEVHNVEVSTNNTLTLEQELNALKLNNAIAEISTI